MNDAKAKPTTSVYCPSCRKEAVPIYGTKGKAWMCWECNHGWRITDEKADIKAKAS